MVLGVVLAAGAGSRFGGDVKALAPFRGLPLIEWPVAALRDGGIDKVVVVLGNDAEQVRCGADLSGCDVVVAGDWEQGVSRSLAAGLDAAERLSADAVVVVLADQPLLSGIAVARVIAARSPGTVAVRATYAGRPGHPALLERTLFDELRALTGDRGASAVLSGRPVAEVACDDAGSDADADTPETLAVLEARGGSSSRR